MLSLEPRTLLLAQLLLVLLIWQDLLGICAGEYWAERGTYSIPVLWGIV